MRTQARILTARKAAEALIDRFQVAAPPIDVALIARLLGLKIIYNDLGERVSGLLITKDNTRAICVRESDALVRQRFTIAHEIGHFALRHQFEPGEHVHVDEGWKMTARSSMKSGNVDPKEVEANQFAAALLMPEAMLKQQVVLQFGNSGLDDDYVAALARQFKVSEQAMAFRVQTLGL